MIMFVFEQIYVVCIFVVGDMMFDCYWFGDVDWILLEVLVLVVQIKCQEECFGGVVNVVCNVVVLGVQVIMFGVIGDDELGCIIEMLFGESYVMGYLYCDLVVNMMIKLCVLVCQQ